jgi:hypothetical protein
MSRSYKVVLLGEGRVGKSSIILRFIQGKFDDRQQSTLSASCFDKTIALGGAESARMSLWDTAGQERFHALGPLYYRDAGASLAAAAREIRPILFLLPLTPCLTSHFPAIGQTARCWSTTSLTSRASGGCRTGSRSCGKCWARTL